MVANGCKKHLWNIFVTNYSSILLIHNKPSHTYKGGFTFAWFLLVKSPCLANSRYTYTHIYTNKNIYYIDLCMYRWIHILTKCMHIHIYIYNIIYVNSIYIYICILNFKHTHIYIYTNYYYYIYIYYYICIYINISYIYIYICLYPLWTHDIVPIYLWPTNPRHKVTGCGLAAASASAGLQLKPTWVV